MDDMLHPGEVGVALGRGAVLPALVFGQPFAAPVGDVEGRVGQDKVGLEVGVTVGVEGVTVGDLALDAANSEVHLCQPPRRVVRLLAINRDVGPGALRDAPPPLPLPDWWARMNSTDCTNMPEEPQQGSYTRP